MRATTQIKGGQGAGTRIGQLRERLRQNAAVYVGVPKGEGVYEDGAPLAVIGAVHEFGSADGHIPERSFLRVPLRAAQDEIAAIFKNQLHLVVDSSLTARQLMEQVGARGAAISQEAISGGIAPGNKASTVARKGSSTPLVDTGRLRQSITYKVEGDV